MSEQPLLTGLRPHLNLATIREKYIQEPDGALTLFRIVDRFTVSGTTPEMPPALISFALVISFRAGEFRGPLEMRVKMISPSQSAPPMPETIVPVTFEAPDEKSAQVIGNLSLGVTEPGLYWIVVTLANEEYTRIPLKISYQRQPSIQTG